MIDFLRLSNHRTLLSEMAYYGLNIGLASILLMLALTIQSPLVGIGLVLISKWRIFAVRPRFWWVNIQANMVDIIVGVSIVLLMYQPGAELLTQAILAVLYAVWLVIIKPLSRPMHMMAQSAVALVVGTMALFAVSYEWPLVVVTALQFAMGYSLARHFLQNYDEEHIVTLSLVYGLIFAEIGWLAYHWTFSYPLLLLSPLRLPQATIILLLVSFVLERSYRSWRDHQLIRRQEVLPPAILAAVLIAIILLFFNSVTI